MYYEKRSVLSRCIKSDWETLPGIICNKKIIQQVDDAELQEYWKCQFNIGKKWETWCQLAINNLETINTTGIPLKKLIC